MGLPLPRLILAELLINQKAASAGGAKYLQVLAPTQEDNNENDMPKKYLV
jgi:hypothetical protein